MPNANEYTVLMVVPLALETTSIPYLFDEQHTELGEQHTKLDEQHTKLGEQHTKLGEHRVLSHALGRIGDHNVVVAHAITPSMTYDLLDVFRNIRIGLNIGIAERSKFARDRVRYGDVVINQTTEETTGVYKYERQTALCAGKLVEQRHSRGFPAAAILTAVSALQQDSESTRSQVRLRRQRAIDDAGVRILAGQLHQGLILDKFTPISELDLRLELDRLELLNEITCTSTEHNESSLWASQGFLIIRGISYDSRYASPDHIRDVSATAVAYAIALLSKVIPDVVQEQVPLLHRLGSRVRQLARDDMIQRSREPGHKGPRTNFWSWLDPPDEFLQYETYHSTFKPPHAPWWTTAVEQLHQLCDTCSLLSLHSYSSSCRSALSSMLVSALSASTASQGHTVLYFFFNRLGPRHRFLHDAILSLLAQTQRHAPPGTGVPKIILDHYANGQDPPSISRLCDAFQQILRNLGRTYIILDSLDECTNDGPDGRVQVLEFCRSLIGLEIRDVHVLVTSEASFEGDPRFMSLGLPLFGHLSVTALLSSWRPGDKIKGSPIKWQEYAESILTIRQNFVDVSLASSDASFAYEVAKQISKTQQRLTGSQLATIQSLKGFHHPNIPTEVTNTAQVTPDRPKTLLERLVMSLAAPFALLTAQVGVAVTTGSNPETILDTLPRKTFRGPHADWSIWIVFCAALLFMNVQIFRLGTPILESFLKDSSGFRRQTAHRSLIAHLVFNSVLTSLRYFRWMQQVLLELANLQSAPQSGMHRVVWECTCGHRLFEDFSIFSEASRLSYDLQKSGYDAELWHSSCPPHLYAPFSTISQPGPSFMGTESSGGPALTESQREPQKAQDGKGKTPVSTAEAPSSTTTMDEPQRPSPKIPVEWLYFCFPKADQQHADGYSNIDVTEQICDINMFQMIREEYMRTRSWLQRHFSWTTVTSIDFVQFKLHLFQAPDEDGSFSSDTLAVCADAWNPQDADIRQWMPVPAKSKPCISQRHLMHLWSVQHDKHIVSTVHKWRRILSRISAKHFSNASRRIQNLVASIAPRNNAAAYQPNNDTDIETAMTQFAHLPITRRAEPSSRKCPRLVYDLTPKRIDEQLVGHESKPPDGWGVYLKEGTVIPFFLRYLFAVLITFVVTGVLVYCIKEASRLGMDVFGIWGGVIGLFSLMLGCVVLL